MKGITCKFFQLILLVILTFGFKNHCSALSFLTRPYLQHLTPNEVTIMWVMDGNNNHGWVMYGEGSQLDFQVTDTTRGLIQAYTRINRITLKDLQPGTTYSYQIFSREISQTTNTSATFGLTIQSAAYSFTTPGLTDTITSAVIFNDTHNDSEIITKLIRLAEIPSYDFVFLNGDILDSVPDENTILRNFIRPCTNYFATQKPFMAVRGEHETRNAFARNYFDYLQMGEDNQGYYAFTRGQVFFIALDSGEDKEDDNSEYSGLNAFEPYREEQALWLKNLMESDAYKQAKYRIVFMHLPTFSNTDTETFSIQHCRQLFNPLFNKYKIDALISGHTHKSGIILPDENHLYPIIIGGGYEKTTEESEYNAAVISLTAEPNLLDINIYDYAGRKIAEYSNPEKSETFNFIPKDDLVHKVYAKDNAINIETSENTNAEIYNVLGIRIKTLKLNVGMNEINGLNTAEIYILKIESQTYKVIL